MRAPRNRITTMAAVLLALAVNTAAAKPWHELTVAELRAAILAGELSAEQLTQHYIERIETLDGELASVLALDPTALEQARALDRRLADGHPAGLLHGIPVLLKDNIESRDQPTTAGSLALAENHTRRDAPLVAALREAGAVILGKTNLSEWANFRGERSSSGWSALGGQTRNPFDLTRSPCGSSSGSGAAAAARFALITIGTETNGSIVCPAAANGNVGVKPTVGLISRTHIVPISHTQDTAGPMTMTLADAVLAMAAMMGPDPADPVTLEQPDWNVDDLLAALEQASLEGKRIGVIRDLGNFHPAVLAVFDETVALLEAGGAEMITDISLAWPDGFWTDTYTVLLHEFRYTLNAYLSSLPDEGLNQLDLAALIAFNREQAERQMPWFGQEHFERAEATDGIDSETYLKALARIRSATRDNGIDRLLAEHQLDLLIAPTGGPAWKIDWVTGDHFGGGSATPAAVSGYPSISLPMGQVHGMPVGLSLFAGRYSEPTLIAAAAVFEHMRPALPVAAMSDAGTP